MVVIGTLEGEKTLLMTGGMTTFNGAVLDGEPVPPSVEVIALVVLFRVPPRVALISRLMVQLLLAAKMPFEKFKTLSPALAVKAPQVESTAAGLATSCPSGKLSTKATAFNISAGLGLLSVKVRRLVSFICSAVGENDL